MTGKKLWGKSLFVILLLAVYMMPMGCGDNSKKATGKSKAVASKTPRKKVWIERWSQERPLSQKRAGLAAIAYNRRIYAIGGGDFKSEGLKIFDTVEYTDVSPDGTMGEWKESSKRLTMPRVYPVALVYNGYIYLMGGESKDTIFTGEKGDEKPTLLNSVERAKINDDGSLGEWILEKEVMTFARRGGVLFAHDGWLYAGGGFNGAFLNNIERAKINDDGSLGPWSNEKQWFGEVRYISGFMQKDNRFYVIGGHINSPQRATNSVETASVGEDSHSHTSKWKDTSPLYTRRFLNTAVIKDDTVYTIGGHNTINLTATERATFDKDGVLSDWEPETRLNIARRAASAVVVDNTIYTIGGMIRPMAVSVSIDSVESAIIAPGKKLGNWVEEGGFGYKSYLTWKAAVNEDAKNHVMHGRAYLKRKKYDTVLFDVAEALKVSPDLANAYNLRGDAYFRMRKTDKAIEALEKALSIDDSSMEALIGLGYIYVVKKDYAKALTYYKRAVQAHPDEVIAHYNLGQTYLILEDYTSAIDEFKWMVAKNPDSKEAKHLLEMSTKSLDKKK